MQLASHSQGKSNEKAGLHVGSYYLIHPEIGNWSFLGWERNSLRDQVLSSARNIFWASAICQARCRHFTPHLSLNLHSRKPVRRNDHPNSIPETTEAQRQKEKFSHLEFRLIPTTQEQITGSHLSSWQSPIKSPRRTLPEGERPTTHGWHLLDYACSHQRRSQWLLGHQEGSCHQRHCDERGSGPCLYSVKGNDDGFIKQVMNTRWGRTAALQHVHHSC